MKTNAATMVIASLFWLVGSISGQSDTTFTYQGELVQNGVPANGAFNMEFLLFDSEAGGNQIGTTEVVNGVPVFNGRFTSEVDFGGDAFDNSNRWLEITVNGVVLVPRQPITRTPYAIQTRGIYVNDDESFVGVGRSTQVISNEPFGVYSPVTAGFGGFYMMTDGQNGLPYYGYSAGGDIDAYHYYDGSSGDWHLYNSGFALTADDDGNVGIGTTNPIYPLDVFGTGSRAVNGFNTGTDGLGDGVVGESGSSGGYGVYGRNFESGGFAGVFLGNVSVQGTLSKSSGSFKIDHPLDPENKYLYHSFVESPDMMNIYNGNIKTDNQGYATVELPEWFDALNRDFRYQLTVIDETDSVDFVQAKVVQRIESNRFRIRTSVPITVVSWQVTGVRQDAFAEANRIPVEEDKSDYERGFYLHPEVFGRSHDFNMDAAREARQARILAERQRAGGSTNNDNSSLPRMITAEEAASQRSTVQTEVQE